jgi:hypothetical protein
VVSFSSHLQNLLSQVPFEFIQVSEVSSPDDDVDDDGDNNIGLHNNNNNIGE